jgi:hypothetical protein
MLSGGSNEMRGMRPRFQPRSRSRPGREQPIGDAARAAKAHLSLSRFEDKRSRTLAAGKELALTSRSYVRGAGVGRCLGVGLTLGVGVGVGLCVDSAQYLPPLFNAVGLAPAQTTISLPVQTAV